jgi:hypothetical protein
VDAPRHSTAADDRAEPRQELRRLFRTHGLPDAIRRDNGAPVRMHRVLKANVTKPATTNAHTPTNLWDVLYDDALLGRFDEHTFADPYRTSTFVSSTESACRRTTSQD